MEIVFKLNELDNIIKKEIIPRLKKYKIFLFTGPLGAGKTTFIKNVLKNCGVTDLITSPTFNYVNSYQGKDKKIFNHFDLYRIEDLESFFSLGFDEYFYKKDNFCFVEWPKIIENFLIKSDMKDFICRIELRFCEADIEKRILIIN